jgi:hypothetical protein
MKQTQKIGHQSQEMDVEDVREKGHIHQPPAAPSMKVDAKPAVTDDEGDAVNKHHTDGGKGYNEQKLTDSGASHPAPKPHHPNVAAEPFRKNDHIDHHLEEQEKHEATDEFNERAKQAGNVPG